MAEAHQARVGEFLSELYATMIDPLANGPLTVGETCSKILDEAKRQRQLISEMESIRPNALIEAARLVMAMPDRLPSARYADAIRARADEPPPEEEELETI